MQKHFRKTLLFVGIMFLSMIVSTSNNHWANMKIHYKPDDQTTTSGTLQKSLFVTENDQLRYYYYNVYTKNNKLLIQILHRDLTTHSLTFAKEKSKIQFRDAYDRYIIVQEIDIKTEKSVSFWVIKIVHTKKGHVLQSFPVDSTCDSDGFKFKNQYTLTEIIEYDEIKKHLYVIMDSKTDFNIYKIDLYEKKTTKKLEIIGWFIYSYKKRQTIVGGNSRVLVEATNDQLWIDQRKPVTAQKPSVYKKYNIEDLTKMKIYKSGSQAYNFIGSFFQYVSVSKDLLNMNAFVYKGYQKIKPFGQGSLCSNKKQIKFYSDEQTYFVAVADNDIYYTLVYWNETISDYTVYSSTLRQTVKDKKLWSKYIESFSEALIIVLYDFKFYILTDEAFYVQNGLMIEKTRLDSKVNQTDDLEYILFKYMLEYEKTQKKNNYWKKWN